MSSRLPVELYKIIIDNLKKYSDGATLRACSLTCKAFLHASRFILFRDLHLRGPRQLERLVESPTNPCAYVRRLFLYEGRSADPQFLWLGDALPLIATSLKHITALRLDSLRWGMFNDTERCTLLSGFRHVQELGITLSRFETSAQLNELIASFPSLIKLSCEDAYWNTYLVPVIPLPLGITSIKLGSYHASFFYQLLSQESHPIVGTVEFAIITEWGLEEVGMLLKKLGSHVEYLDLGSLLHVLRHNPQCLESTINLSHNTHLRSIRLEHRPIFIGYPGDVTFILWSQITSPHLERITLEMALMSLADLHHVDWPRIDDYFSRQRWANLHTLVFILSGGVDPRPAAKMFIKAHLPLLEGRGALEVWG